MSIDDVADDTERKQPTYHFDRHTPEYRQQFEKITEEMQSRCPMAWTDVYDGHWVAAGSKEVFELARCPVVSNHHDLTGETPYKGITIPKAQRATVVRGGILEMDEPEHSSYRGGALNPYLSPRCGQALGAVRRRDRPCVARREDRVGAHRLRR